MTLPNDPQISRLQTLLENLIGTVGEIKEQNIRDGEFMRTQLRTLEDTLHKFERQGDQDRARINAVEASEAKLDSRVSQVETDLDALHTGHRDVLAQILDLATAVYGDRNKEQAGLVSRTATLESSRAEDSVYKRITMAVIGVIVTLALGVAANAIQLWIWPSPAQPSPTPIITVVTPTPAIVPTP